ncbi:aldehyde dehydrogenase family protein [Oceanobacter mangrovi]|uniref:aldehyde dehydrogenase family protein n=1 Tax=Oceanobacter mangrovi TaxID=2862510 RepID=UPI001C8DE24B|nr:aldehyde dehydrogenase family protein [Oceanobacter mangrovi]
MIRIENYLGNNRQASQPAGYLQSVNPYNREAIAEFPCSGKAEVDEAVASAEQALVGWRQTSATQRADYLDRIASAIELRSEQIAAAITASCGKPLTEAGYDVLDSIDCYRYYAALARELAAQQDAQGLQAVAIADPAFSSRLRREPVGVVALITPWNFPTVTTSWKLAPALAAGCTVVLKPSEVTPLPESILAEICTAAGLPAGVVNIVYGAGEAGAALVSHPQVRKVSFTGSTATGARIALETAAEIKNLSLELGGKSSIIVFDDADMEVALQAIMGGIFFNNGQICSATSRLLVHEGIAAELLAQLQQRVAQLKPSNPATAEAVLGPLACEAQFNKVMEYLAIAEAEGLQCLNGGKACSDGVSQWMVEPTVYVDVPVSSRLWQEEIFGPVLCCRTFATVEEAIERANDCEYGLAATVVSGDEQRAEAVACQLEAGHIWLNCDQKVLVETSWGGMKKSGLGRELGPWGLSAFTEVKHITRKS